MELLHVMHRSRASNKQLVGRMFLLQQSKYILTEDYPKLFSIFGNIFGIMVNLKSSSCQQCPTYGLYL